ncbi:uncharacterized protein TRIADDRAFT_19671 [Trichoplax adhaerens]|uniref:NWD2 C-terminal beta-propeller domain-containing protein n=1 Tax=Trichoplax adhaerens TaxID=10228 RepID=B3RLF7_TRIAD|nr:hypothetical protein TRIADDRAFT_19671 [Trichoplax adhaerens]EDV28761.1 hypothetical protein TRIADDRAFT_19671 [Trichoplax adhaerens]|eukprot:XP_002107963.1 hypothetical protein TRIADDRAFT_19671 [Trichoplax adhaerens]
MRLSYQTLDQDAFSLAAELIGQLSTLASNEYQYLQLLIESAEEIGAQHSPLLPVTSCLFPPGGVLRYTLHDCKGEILCLETTSNFQYILAGSTDHLVRVWNVTTGELIHTLDKHTSAVHGVHVTSDCRIILSYTYNIDVIANHEVLAWNLQTGEYLYNLQLPRHKKDITFITICKEKNYYVSGSIDNTLKKWDLETGELLETLTISSGFLYSVHIMPHGQTRNERYLLTGSSDTTVIIWDMETRKIHGKMAAHQSSIKSIAVAITENKLIAASGSDRGVVCLWDFHQPNCKVMHQLEGHQSSVEGLTFALDDNYLISMSTKESVLKIWHTKRGYLIANYYLHANPTNFTECAKKNIIIIGLEDGRVMRLKVNRLTDEYLKFDDDQATVCTCL